ncbi:MAG: Gfo/Idh/MocA family oxidoreductase [Rhodobacteraceae bacterium]|nr:Gfo/Idh/MocA family oxidoreductase [Paracoccaceae bacterium]
MLTAVMVGCGAMSKGWLQALRDTPFLAQNIRMTGFVDLDESAARARADEFGWTDAQTGHDLNAMLSAQQPDLVFDIVVPPARAEVVEMSLRHGCHVLSEKPMAETLDGARRLIALASGAGRRHAIVQNRRWLPGIRRARAFIDSGSLGAVTAVHCDFFLGAHFGGFREQMRNVLLLDMAIHTFDAARFVSGQDATAVYCRETNPKGSWYAHGAAADALFDMTDGIAMTYRGSWAAEGANTAWEASWRIVGTKGTLLWDGNDGFTANVVDGDQGFLRPLRAVDVPPLATPLTQGHAGVLADFVTAVQNGTAPLTCGSDNIKSLAMVLAAIKSAQLGQRVSLSDI